MKTYISFIILFNGFHHSGNSPRRDNVGICMAFFFLITLPQLTSAESNGSLVKLVKQIKPAIVSIELFDNTHELIGEATGFMMTQDGLVVTNWHVIEKASSAFVSTFQGAKFEVKGVVGEDLLRDIAIIAIKSEKADLPFLKLSYRKAEQGERIVVMGNPLGLEFTLSEGIVSATRNIGGILEIVQISAPISEGSSGSPVVDMEGEVVAIAFAGSEKGQNLNFCVSSSHIQALHKKTEKNIASLKALNRSGKIDSYLQARNLVQKGIVFLGEQKYLETLQMADQIIANVPQLPDGYALQSASYIGLEQYDKALVALNKTIERDPEEPIYYSNRGYVFTYLLKFDQALNDYDIAIKMDGPQTASFYAGRANTYNEMDEAVFALKDINKAIELDPLKADYYMSRSYYQFSIGNTSEVIKDLEKAWILYPEGIDKLSVECALYASKGEKDKAIQCLKKAARMGHEGSRLALENMGIQE